MIKLIIKKIKMFFYNVFMGKGIKQINASFEEDANKVPEQTNFIEEVSSKVDNNSLSVQELANQIMSDEVDCYNLTDEQADTMIEYFIKDIAKKENELEKIKNHILEMKNNANNTDK